MGDNARMLLKEAGAIVVGNPHFVVMSLADDWEGLYVNDILVRQGHSIRVYDILEVAEELGIITFNQFEDWSILEESGESHAPDELPDDYKGK
jgi:hypothetical protein